MAKPKLQPIYNRLNGVQRYHPMSANTYGDWAMEAGDTVTVNQGNDSYQAPVHTMKLRWHGKQEIEINSDGNRERTPVSKVSQQKYNSGRGGGSYRSNQGLYYEMESEDGLLHATISATAQALTTEYRETVNGVKDALTGTIEQTARSLTSTYDNKISQVRSQIKQEADRISLVVEGTGANAKIKPAAIIASINNGKSKIKLSADTIDIDGIVTKLESIAVTANTIRSKHRLTVENDGVLNYGVYMQKIGSGNIVTFNVYDADTSNSGKTLNIYKTNGTVLSFSRAVTSASWSWVNGSARVSLQPQDQNFSSPAVDNYTKQGNPSYSSTTKLVSQNVVIVDEDGNTVKTMNMSLGISSFLQTKTITSNGTYTPDTGKAGFSSVIVDVPTGGGHDIDIPSAYIYTTAGSPPSGSTELSTMRTRVLQAIDDSETLVFRVDCGDARKHYHMSF